ncbi:MAG TPA: penicillin-binding protein 2 [Anaerolineae bacterium]|nr:penicillin-binding protein 2 [Anaerolineae bacterium]
MDCKRRLTLYRLVVILAFVVLAAQLWRLQIVRGEQYRLMADRNRFRLVPFDAPRGVIYDRHGRILVRNVPSFSVTIVPAYLPEDEEEEKAVFARLSALLGIPATSATASPVGGIAPRKGIKEMVEEARKVAPYSPVTIKTNVDRQTVFIIEEEHLDLPGVLIEVDPIRQYPTGALTSHIIGYVGPIPRERAEDYRKRGYDLNDKVGLTGVELAFEEELRGEKGCKYIEVDAAGREVRQVGDPHPPQPGHNLVLTLDLDLQQFMAEALRRGMEAAGSESGVAIAMNPKTGEVLGMVSLPSYDNNLFSGGISAEDYARLSSDPNHPLVNHAISGQYPPGSTIKPVHAAAALEEGVVDRDTTLTCQGIMWLPNKYFPEDPALAQPFYCWIHKYGRGHGRLNIVESIAHSCDIFFYQLAGGFEDFEGLGLERLAHYARLFGLGERTGIGLPGESVGLVPSKQWKWLNYHENWATGDTYNVAIGQGFILVTPLQMLNATVAIANGGTLYRPQIVYQLTDADGHVVKSFAPEVIREVPVSEENLAIVREGMRAAVEWGTARGADLEGVTVAGKTGTAEYPGPLDEEGNLPTHAWFTAFAPVEDPEIALVVFVAGGGEGTRTAVPIAAEILRYYFGLPEPEPTP